MRALIDLARARCTVSEMQYNSQYHSSLYCVRDAVQQAVPLVVVPCQRYSTTVSADLTPARCTGSDMSVPRSSYSQ
eukprot:994243-Rhodomonas_salina.5